MILLKIFLTFLKIGAFTFGGGYAMLPFIQAEAINHGWATMDELIDFIAVSESTPGPFAANISTYIGVKTAGIIGAVCATGGVILPSFIIILIVAKIYEEFKKNKIVQSCLNGLKPAAIGLIAASTVSVAKQVFFADGFVFKAEFFISLVIFCVMMYLALNKKNPILIIMLSAILGIAGGYMFL